MPNPLYRKVVYLKTPQEDQQVEIRARILGLKVSSYIRNLILKDLNLIPESPNPQSPTIPTELIHRIELLEKQLNPQTTNPKPELPQPPEPEPNSNYNNFIGMNDPDADQEQLEAIKDLLE